MMQKPTLESYEPIIKLVARKYFYLYRGQGDFEIEDFEQAGRIELLKMAQKRPDKLSNPAYVTQVIKYGVFDEMKKMYRREKHVYLIDKEDEEMVNIQDIFPTGILGDKADETSMRSDELDEILYRIKQDFSKDSADTLEALLDKCDNIYGLNLSEPPSTDIKDKVKVVTQISLEDREMLVYAERLLGVRERFPKHWVGSEPSLKEISRERGARYLQAVLNSIGMTPREFVSSGKTKQTIIKYDLFCFYQFAFDTNILDYVQQLDPSISLQEVFHKPGNLTNGVSADIVRQRISELRDKVEHIPTKKDFRADKLGGVLNQIFRNSSRLAIEFAFPGSYPKHSVEAEKIRNRLQQELLAKSQ